jgi:hypothetical protein
MDTLANEGVASDGFFSFFPHFFFGERRWGVVFILAVTFGRFQLFLIPRAYDVVGGVVAVTCWFVWQSRDSVVFEYFLHFGPVLLASGIDVGIVIGELNAIVSVESILQRRRQSSLWSLK